MINYHQKYLKYKSKYNKLLNQRGNADEFIGNKCDCYSIMDKKEREYIKHKKKLTLKDLKNISSFCVPDKSLPEWEEIQKLKNERKEFCKTSDKTNSFIKLADLKNNVGYCIQDNGGMPYKVVANPKFIAIFDNETRKKLFHYENIDGYWPGIDISSPGLDGNTVLIKITDYKYVLVAAQIYEFETDDKIIDFASLLGSSSITWPVGFGEDNIYLFSYRSYMDKKYFEDTNIFDKMAIAYYTFDEYDKKGTNLGHDIKNINVLADSDPYWLQALD